MGKTSLKCLFRKIELQNSGTLFSGGNIQYIAVHVCTEITEFTRNNMYCNVLYVPLAIFGLGNVQLKRFPEFCNSILRNGHFMS